MKEVGLEEECKRKLESAFLFSLFRDQCHVVLENDAVICLTDSSNSTLCELVRPYGLSSAFEGT